MIVLPKIRFLARLGKDVLKWNVSKQFKRWCVAKFSVRRSREKLRRAQENSGARAAAVQSSMDLGAASPIFNLNNHQSKVLTLVKPETPGSLIGPVQFLFKAGTYLDLAGPTLPIAKIHDQTMSWQ